MYSSALENQTSNTSIYIKNTEKLKSLRLKAEYIDTKPWSPWPCTHLAQ